MRNLGPIIVVLLMLWSAGCEPEAGPAQPQDGTQSQGQTEGGQLPPDQVVLTGPQATLETLHKAARIGDQESTLACFSPDTRAALQQLRELGAYEIDPLADLAQQEAASTPTGTLMDSDEMVVVTLDRPIATFHRDRKTALRFVKAEETFLISLPQLEVQAQFAAEHRSEGE